jgi:hypothetical protein
MPSPAPAPAPDPTPSVSTPAPLPTTEEQVDPNLSQSTADETASVDKQINDILATPPPEEPEETATPATPPSAAPAEDQEQSASLPTEAPVQQIAVTAPPEADAGAKAAQLADAVNDIMQNSSTESAPSTPIIPTPAAPSVETPPSGKKVITPISDPTVKPDLNKLLAEEEQHEAATKAGGTVAPGGTPPPPIATPPDLNDPNNIAL